MCLCGRWTKKNRENFSREISLLHFFSLSSFVVNKYIYLFKRVAKRLQLTFQEILICKSCFMPESNLLSSGRSKNFSKWTCLVRFKKVHVSNGEHYVDFFFKNSLSLKLILIIIFRNDKKDSFSFFRSWKEIVIVFSYFYKLWKPFFRRLHQSVRNTFCDVFSKITSFRMIFCFLFYVYIFKIIDFFQYF